jgi:dTDP-4-dehydrorhamnose 3,5-epimerase
MHFHDTAIAGVLVVELERLEDARGFFARSFDARAFAERGLAGVMIQQSVSFNSARGTLRGMHWQEDEEKLIRCTQGAVLDVAVDLRRESPTFKRWLAVELSARNWKQIYFPRGVAHGFVTLADDSELQYQMSVEYRPERQRGVRWNDPAFAIEWPLVPSVISDRDANFPDFQ